MHKFYRLSIGLSSFSKVVSIGLFCFSLMACSSDKKSTPASSVSPKVQNASPVAHIVNPRDGSAFTQGDSILFSGAGTDPEDGTLTNASLAWSSNLDGALGTGTSLAITTLSVGTHQISLTATDSKNATGTAVITIVITPLFHIAGRISTAARNGADGDSNDPNEAFLPNNTLETAQKLSNPATVSGFLTKSATGGGPGGNDRFAAYPDEDDIFQITLAAGQVLYLQIADWLEQNNTANDLDLYLTDSQGNLLTSSEGTGRAEQLNISQGGDFYIWVHAYSGTSNYVLTVSDATTVTQGETSKERLGVGDEFIPGQALVKFQEGKFAATGNSGNRLAATAASLGLKAETTLAGRANLMSFDLTRKAADLVSSSQSILLAAQKAGLQVAPEVAAKLATLECIKNLRQQPGVAFAEPNRIRHAAFAPDDAFYPQQWDFPVINVPNAWDITDGNGVIVAVIDTGVYLNHPDLMEQLVPGYDFVSDPAGSGDGDGIDDNPDDPGDGASIAASSFHGTHVAGTIAARTNNSQGIAGIAYHARLMPLRALGPVGGTDADIAQCIYFSAGLSNNSGTLPSRRADIINMSLGGPGQSQTLAEAIKAARGTGVIVIAAAGNENTDTFYSPADEEGVIAVSAVGQDGLKAYYSNFGPHIDVAAPGGNLRYDTGILSTSAQDDGAGLRAPAYKAMQGTSMAAPHMSGVVALMKSVYPALGPDDLDALLVNNQITIDIGAAGPDAIYGYGLIDAVQAVHAAQQLSGGGSLPGYLTVNPTTYDFGINTETVVKVTARNARVAQIVNEATWLTITPQTVDANGVGDYHLEVNRTGLTPARYTTDVSFVADNNQVSRLRIYMNVLSGGGENTGTVGLVYVLLLNEDATESLHTVEAVADAAGYHFTFSNVRQGNYRLIAGTDHDNDQYVCDAGEACGAYPTMDNFLLLQISGDMENLEFIVSPDTQLVPKNSAFTKTALKKKWVPLQPPRR